MLPNQVYYFEVGQGRWGGSFDFRITDRQAYRTASIGLVNRLMILAMRVIIALPGRPAISSQITIDAADGPAGTARNTYSVSKWGVPLFVFQDVYRLNADGQNVAVTTDIRYGPVPGILTGEAAYPAQIFDGGFRSRYDGLQVLGAVWVAAYHVAPDKNHVTGVLTCPWAEAGEQMFRRTG